MDIRHPLSELDRQMFLWGGRAGVPMLALLTKADKLKVGAVKTTVRAVERALAEMVGTSEVVHFSALRREGVEAVQARLDAWLEIASGVSRGPPDGPTDGG
jgi:GTP-binding protein